MTLLQLPAVIAALTCTASAATPDAPLVYCGGYGCAGPGIVMYEYPIDSGSYPMMEFRVGTNDLDLEHYFDVQAPEGWSFTVDEVGLSHSCELFARHGDVSQAACDSLTTGSARWWTDDPVHAVEHFTFGYRHIWPPEDVGWALTTRRDGEPPDVYVFTEFWDAPSGTGVGPLHGPYPPGEGCGSGDDCDEGWSCFFPECADETGTCMPRPEVCVEIYLPVCGCDGVTYDNACFAAMAGASVAHPGTCGCVADVDGDGRIGFGDLLRVLSAWGPCAACPEDLNASGDVGFDDLLIVLGTWGPCAPWAPYVAGYGNSGCRRGDEWPCPEDDSIELTVDGGLLHTLHRNATYNCCPDDLAVTLAVDGDVLRVTETEIVSIPCSCICCYDVDAAIANIPSGTWLVEYCWVDYETGDDRCHVQQIVIP